MKEVIKQILSEVSGLPVGIFKDEERDFTLADIDSLEFMEMLVKIERHYNIIIPDSDAKKLKTVGAIVSYLRKKGTKI